MANNTNNNTNNMIEDIDKLMKVRLEKYENLIEEGKNPFEITKFNRTHVISDIMEDPKKHLDKTVVIAARIMTKRVMGKASFAHVQDGSGRMQIYLSINDLGDDYKDFKKYDLGDIIGIEGFVFTTQTGETTIHATKIVLLSKALRPLPDKHSGLKDRDQRYRHREVDLIVNPEIKDTFYKRIKILGEIKKFLAKRGYLEVETPILQTVAGGASARPFITHHNTLDIDMYLRIANELYLKRLIIGGLEKVYEMGKMFRNEGMDIKHNPEFTNIELYEAYSDYKDMMDLTEDLFVDVAENVLGTTELEYMGQKYDLSKGWKRITMTDSIKEVCGIDFNEIQTDEEAIKVAENLGIELEEFDKSRGRIMNLVFEEKVEETLIQPTFIYDYPIEISPLTKKKKEDPRLTERFELFIGGREYANAYSELNDPIDQYERFVKQLEDKEKGDDEANDMDSDFIQALEYGMPPTGGLGIGIDRMVMLYTNSESIRDVLLFPTMKPLGKDGKEVESKRITDIDLSKVKIEPLFEDMVDFETFSKSDFRVVKVKNCEEVPKSKKLLKFTLNDGTGKDRIILSGIKDYYNAEKLVGKTLLAITNLPERKIMGEASQGMLLSAIYEYDGEEQLNLIMLDNNIPAGSKIY